MDNSIGIYIHVPFCKSKCYYCDFNSYSGREYLAGPYFDALLSEMEFISDALKERPVRSIFIGGGTPSLVNPQYISSLLEACFSFFKVDSDAEISLESNPGTLSYENLKTYRTAGVNRLSIGLQAWQDRLLEAMGRIHQKQQFVDNLEAAYEVGFRNINIDLIFGLPGQAFGDWKETLDAVTALGSTRGITHLSCYSLKIEEGTSFGDRLDAGTLKPVEDELDRSMYRYTVEALAQNGYKHYEISNFAKTGFECKHNLIYWKALEYAGFGAGAHSYLNNKRYSNVASIEKYIEATTNIAEGILYEDTSFIDKHESMSEFMILGLRLIDGVRADEFEARYGESLQAVYGEKLEKLVKKGLLLKELDGDTNGSSCSVGKNSSDSCSGNVSGGICFKLTPLGLDLANTVFMEFV